MQEGDLTHEEINAAIAQAEKTIIFAKQNRLRDGVLLPDDKLQRFSANHDNVKFFYSALRQIPEYLLDALLARNITATLIVGQGMLHFRDVRAWSAVHIGRTRRTIYLPEKILEVAHDNGYDYWSIAHIVVTQGWKLLDFAMLNDMVEAVRQQAIERSTTVVGYSAFRRLLKRFNRHRSVYESPELMEQRRKAGLEHVPINEIQEFAALYEPKFVRVLSDLLGKDPTIGALAAQTLGLSEEEAREQVVELKQESAEALSSDAVAKLLYDEHYEEIWSQRKSTELFEEMGFPDFFLLDRDILHPAAREMAAAAGQDPEPRTMDEARHDFRDHMRFGIGTSFGREKLLELAPGFGADGILGLIEEVMLPLYERGEIDKTLSEEARGVAKLASKRSEFYVYWGRGLDLVRLRDTLQLWHQVKTGQRPLRLEDRDMLQRVSILLSASRSGMDPRRMQMLGAIEDLEELLQSFRGLIVGEAHRVFDMTIEADERITSIPERMEVFHHLTAKLDAPESEPELPKVTVWQLLAEQLETAVVEATLCLDLHPEYVQLVAGLAHRGEIARGVLEAFIESVESTAGLGYDTSAQQAVVARARRALAGDEPEEGEEDELLVSIVAQVGEIVELIPERFHTFTSGKVSPLRRTMKEFEEVRRRHPTSPEQLGHLAMVLVRLDGVEHYETLLGIVKALGEHAVGEVLQRKGWRFPRRTPGLLKLAEEGDFDEKALSLAEEITGKSRDELLEVRHVMQGD